MSVKITGLDELQRKLRDMSDRARALDGKHSVSFSELFNPAFMRKHTQFSSMDELFAQGGFKVESQEDLEAIPEHKLDAFIAAHSQLRSWQELKEKAGAAWAKKKMGF